MRSTEMRRAVDIGCNCNKNKVKAPTPLPQQQRMQAQRQQSSMPAMKPAKGRTDSFELRLRDGTTMTFGSRLEAEAENVRLGYRGRVSPI